MREYKIALKCQTPIPRGLLDQAFKEENKESGKNPTKIDRFAFDDHKMDQVNQPDRIQAWPSKKKPTYLVNSEGAITPEILN